MDKGFLIPASLAGATARAAPPYGYHLFTIVNDWIRKFTADCRNDAPFTTFCPATSTIASQVRSGAKDCLRRAFATSTVPNLHELLETELLELE
ncbi:hypothetical protein [Mesorhizobium xinjiangense]|uniref:hypothetical protein n=1 Tax=Mesorhizobium xinjiangense TaxID=2678685 RepID=UPI0012EE921B|nr:hypothetical protein [Mesorhizobium xinjiangense]